MKRIPVIMIASLFVIGIPAITQSDPVPKKNGNKYVLYEERTDNGAVCHLFQAQQANGCLEKPMVKGTLFRCGVWQWKKSKETRNRKRHTKRVNKYRKKEYYDIR